MEPKGSLQCSWEPALPLDFILNQMNPGHILILNFLEIQFNADFPSVSMSPKFFLTKTVYAFLISPTQV